MMPNLRAIPKEKGLIAGYISHFAPREISNLFIGLIIFFSATQLGFHFWPNSTLVYGIRIDYLAPTVYLFDLLLLGYLITRRSVLKRNSRLQVEKGSPAGERTDLTGTMIPILLVNLLFSANPLSTLSWSLHFLLYLAFIRSVLAPGSDLLRKSWLSAKMFSRTSKTSSETRSDPQGIISIALTLSLLFQTVLALAQVALGHSLGGFMYYLGERMVSVGHPGVATASFLGATMLRAYGTFSHPNILAGFAAICLLILLKLSSATKGSDPLRKFWRNAKMFSRLQNTIRRPGQTLWVPIILASTLIFLTQSRSASISLFGLIIPFYLLRSWHPRLLYFMAILTTSYYLLTTGALARTIDPPLSERLDLQRVSLQVFERFPLFGTGTQASINTYPLVSSTTRLLQPDHNSFSLLLSWFGVFGVLALFLGLDLIPRTLLKRKTWLQAKLGSAAAERRVLMGTLLPLLPLLLLDHYLLTSPQGLFSLLLYLKVVSH